MITNTKLNFFKKDLIPEPKALPSSSAVHFIQSNTPAIVIATFQKVMEWVRPLFHYLFPKYVANASTKSVSLKTKTQSLPTMIKEWGQNHRSLLKKTAGLVLLLGTMYTAYKLFPFFKAAEVSVPPLEKSPGQDLVDESIVKNSLISNYLPFVIIALFLAAFNGALAKYGENSKRSIQDKNLQPNLNQDPLNGSEANQINNSDLLERSKDLSKSGSLRNVVLFQTFEDVKKLLMQDSDINAKDKNGNTLLHVVAQFGTVDIIEKFLEQDGIEINAKNNLNETPLHLAAQFGTVDIIEKLLEQDGIEINAKNNLNETPLHLAVQFGTVDIIKKLLKHSKIEINAKDSEGNTPLYLAVKSKKFEKVKELLNDIKIEINEQNDWGNTPLHQAVLIGKVKIIQLLIEKGADVSIVNNQLEKAVDLAKSDEIKKLLKNSAQPEEIKNQATKEQLIQENEEIKQEKEESL